ncbi:hypothetical protein DU68_11425 [Methanosarcina mazei]|uniref:Uncharacterized protein n=1 Tax=Methanosarcina mazei TaxID=2209 RepID=A0A0F8J7G0_METMZ|nr:hypothetical protein DU33_11595 [Methanosarcina mazei]KKG57526.1 hypothetical protein DU45_11875 [Methanosarcina mazei]KKG64850.1 hypothetical protein DU64_09780 [Methanosarcina mazei]KKG96680.1 hypothetical protein DU68_11425 [Methanosarcina mazei]KKG98603.1 hypothetical protein DU56_11345 [Methanosarcina mazei]
MRLSKVRLSYRIHKGYGGRETGAQEPIKINLKVIQLLKIWTDKTEQANLSNTRHKLAGTLYIIKNK